MIKAGDGNDGEGFAMVSIAIEDVPEDPPPATSAPGVSLADGTFTLAWDTVSGAGSYEPQYRTGGSGFQWTSLTVTTNGSTTFSPAGRPMNSGCRPTETA